MRLLPPVRQPSPERPSRWTFGVADLALAAALLIGAPGVAWAACTDAPEVCAKRAFEAGISAYREGRYEAALDEFRAAQQLRPHPVVLFNVALAEARVGLLVESLEHLTQVYDDPKTPEDLLGKVRAERDVTAARVAAVSLADDRAQLIVDGDQATGSPPRIDVNPGEHDVVIFVDGKQVERRTLRLSPGEKLELAVPEPERSAAPEPPPEAPPEAPPEPLPPPPAAAPVEEESRGVAPVWVYAGAGATAVLGGATLWSGLDTRRAFHDYEDEVDGLSASQRDDRVEAGRAKQFRTNVLVGATSAVGLATVATGLFLVDWPARGHKSSLTLGPTGVSYQRHF